MLRDWVGDARSLAQATLALAEAETRQTGVSLVAMIAWGIAFILLLICTWLCLVGAGVAALNAAGLAMPWALLIAAGTHLALAVWVQMRFRHAERGLGWHETLRSLANTDKNPGPPADQP